MIIILIGSQVAFLSIGEIHLIDFLSSQGKNTADDESRALKSSKNFFKQLQDNVTTVKSKSLGKKKKFVSDSSQHESSAKRFKL